MRKNQLTDQPIYYKQTEKSIQNYSFQKGNTVHIKILKWRHCHSRVREIEVRAFIVSNLKRPGNKKCLELLIINIAQKKAYIRFYTNLIRPLDASYTLKLSVHLRSKSLLNRSSCCGCGCGSCLYLQPLKRMAEYAECQSVTGSVKNRSIF